MAGVGYIYVSTAAVNSVISVVPTTTLMMKSLPQVDRSRGLISIVLELGETDLDQLLRQYKANIVSSR